MNKNIFIIPILSSVLLFSSVASVLAQNTGTEMAERNTASSKGAPQDSCLNILSQYVEKDSRFGGVNLKGMKERQKGSRVNLTDYSRGTFLQYAQRNPKTRSTSFYANRNNIGTISVNKSYIVSEFVTFGNETHFRFPYVNPEKKGRETGKSETDVLTDDYGVIKDKLLYMHHIKDPYNKKGHFLSCGFLKITPKNGHSHTDTSANNYKTNFIDASGFELLRSQHNPEIDGYGNRFIVGKVNVPIKNYADQHHMTLELITVAYDNKSSYFNEFETFPLQVKAMTNEDAKRDVNVAQRKFLELVSTETCLELVHSSILDLPQKCNGKTKSLTAEGKTTAYKNFLNFFIPKVGAQEIELILDESSNEDINIEAGFSDNPDDYSHLPRGMYVNDALSFEKLKKLESLNNPFLTDHVMKALSDGIEYVMEVNSTGSTAEAYDNRTFLQCGMDYSTRVKLINEWIDGIDVNTFSIDNITYPDPKIGDCLIPFPDARHRDKIIENSFLTNQYNAAVLSGNNEKIKELEPILEIGEYKNNAILPDSTLSNSLVMIIGIIMLLGGVGILVFLLKNKNTKK